MFSLTSPCSCTTRQRLLFYRRPYARYTPCLYPLSRHCKLCPMGQGASSRPSIISASSRNGTYQHSCVYNWITRLTNSSISKSSKQLRKYTKQCNTHVERRQCINCTDTFMAVRTASRLCLACRRSEKWKLIRADPVRHAHVRKIKQQSKIRIRKLQRAERVKAGRQKCLKCGKSVEFKQGLIMHIRHTACNELECHLCPATFSRKTALQYHLAWRVCIREDKPQKKQTESKPTLTDKQRARRNELRNARGRKMKDLAAQPGALTHAAARPLRSSVLRAMW